jgi:hypothetical protein
METQKITHDLTDGQQEAVLIPAYIYKQAMTAWFQGLEVIDTKRIRNVFMSRVGACQSTKDINELCRQFINEQALVSNIANNNWSAFEIQPEVKTLTEQELLFVGAMSKPTILTEKQAKESPLSDNGILVMERNQPDGEGYHLVSISYYRAKHQLTNV